jgi:hypothetical protein
MLDVALVNTERIDFISSYCDRWCERCAYTSRCAAFTTAAAIAMCGDVAEDVPPEWVADGEDGEPAAEERARFERRKNERDARVRASSIMQIARACAMISHRWLTARYESLLASADAVLTEALAVVLHDAFFVSVKLNRALDGRDRYEHEERDGHPVQNDWNGSAKVALISLERSEAAWRVIAQATCEQTPAVLADRLQDLVREVEEAFPSARLFIRPGFDEPGR